MKKPLIVMSGGGTLGSVMPLLSIHQALADQADWLWLGTYHGLEKQVVEERGIEYRPIASGKWRRYWDWRNLRDVFLIIAGGCQAWWTLARRRPQLFITAGGFVGLPAAWSAKLCGAKVLLHQLDARPGLANLLAAPIADAVAVVWSKSLADYGRKAVKTGSLALAPINDSPQQAKESLGLNGAKPTVLIMGGGTGALGINDLLAESWPELQGSCQVIHITGRGKKAADTASVDYHSYELLSPDKLALAYAAAEVVVSRAGMGSLLDLAANAKAAIIIPLPKSHQLDNAKPLTDAEAAVVVDQAALDGKLLAALIRSLLKDDKKRQRLGCNLKKLLNDSDRLIDQVKILAGLTTNE